MSGVTVYVEQRPVTELAAGDIVISVGRALVLAGEPRTVCGYDEWSYSVHGPGGAMSQGITGLYRGGTARVLVVAPAAG